MFKSANISYLFFLSFVAAMGGILFGYDTAVISGTIAQVKTQFGLDSAMQGWYVGCALTGSIAGVAVAGTLSDKIGRKPALLISSFLFAFSSAGCALCLSFNGLVIYRIIGGVGIGIVSIVSPLYISEISPAFIRGRLVSLYQLAITFGFLCAYFANYWLVSYFGENHMLSSAFFHKILNTEIWRGMLGLELLPALLFMAVIAFIPESPRWLINKQNESKAKKTFYEIFRNDSDVESEIASIKNSLSGSSTTNIRQIMNPGLAKALIIGMLLAILGQFMGVNAVLYYGPSIFSNSGLSDGNSLLYQTIIGVVNFLSTLIALLIIDKVGRKKLIYIGVTGMIVSLIIISLNQSEFNVFGKGPLMLIGFITYIFCAAMSICVVIWVILSEMYPTKIRGTAMSIAGFSLWTGTFLIGQFTPWMLYTLTPSGTFLLFAVVGLIYMFIFWKYVPETAGKSLEEIETIWQNRKSKI